MPSNTPPPGNIKPEGDIHPPEKTTEFAQEDDATSAVLLGENTPEDDSWTEKLKAWLCVLATFFLFMNAWYYFQPIPT
jgi:hypothetical protein